MKMYESDTEFKMQLPGDIQNAIERLKENGFSAFCVGGSVRDSMLGRTVSDYDMCTDALPEQIISVFGEENTIPTGIKHGTVTVKLTFGLCEITTFRCDGEYLDSRHPCEVSFTRNIYEDLKRRDFTVNAMAYSPKEGLIDPFGGKSDLKKGIIRTVGNPDDRFGEDALRIMRAVRFSSQLSFEIELKTDESIHRLCSNIGKISVERIFSELCKTLGGANAKNALDRYRDVIAVFIPEIKKCFGFDQKSPFHDADVYTHILRSVDFAPKNDTTVRLALFLHDIAKPVCFTEDESGRRHFMGHAETGAKMAREILLRLKRSRKTADDVFALIENHENFVKPERAAVLHAASKFGADFLRKLFILQSADAAAHSPGHTQPRLENSLKCIKLLDEAIEKNECFTLSDLKISGNEVKNLVPPDKRFMISRILNKLLAEVIDEKTENKPDKLKLRAAEIASGLQ